MEDLPKDGARQLVLAEVQPAYENFGFLSREKKKGGKKKKKRGREL